MELIMSQDQMVKAGQSKSTSLRVKVQVSKFWDLYFIFETCTLTFCMTEFGKNSQKTMFFC